MGEPLRLRLPAEPTFAAVARSALAVWFTPLPWPAETVEDVVFATSEAVANCVDHAYRGSAGGTVLVGAHEHLDGDRICVEVTVTDDGRWQEPAPDQGFRGRGIAMMRSLTEWFTERGTRAILRCWRPIPAHGVGNTSSTGG